MKRRPLVSQGSLARMGQAVEEAWKRRDFQQALETLERASRMNPANHKILLDLGRLHGKRYDYAAAEQTFEKAVRVSPTKTETLAEAGDRAREFGNYSMAERFLVRALEQKDVSPDALVKLAAVYERLRRLDEASTLVDRALQSNSNFAPALLARAKLDRQTGRLAEAENVLRSSLPSFEPAIRSQGWYELGGILDRQGRYDEAMSAFLEAKAILRPNATRHIHELQITRGRLKTLRENLTAELLKRWFDFSGELQPPRRMALLCGHPRSGTTLLEQVVDSHPDVVSAEETDIFHDDAYMPLTRGLPDDAPMLSVLESAEAAALRQSRQNYSSTVEKLLGKPVGSRLLIDKNPSLTFMIAPFIRVFPETKFLVALRDPRDVCLSCFMQALPLNQAAAAFLGLEGTVEEYSAVMSMWQALAPLMQNPHIEVRYEDMVDDLETSSRRTLEFLGIPWDKEVLRFDEHARKKTVRSPTYADVTKPVFKTAVGRWRNYQKYLEPHLEKLAPFAKAFGYE